MDLLLVSLKSVFLCIIFLFVVFAVFMAFCGVAIDASSPPEYSIKTISNTDKLVLFIDVVGYASIYFCGVFIIPTKFRQFFKYVKLSNRVGN